MSNHLRPVGTVRPVWCPHDTRKLAEDAQRVDPKPRLREWLWAPLLVAAAILSGLITAPHAKAGVIGVLKGVMSTGGFTADNAVDVVNASVQGQCDEWWPLLQRIGRQARGEMAV